jgi:hypothetical protein
LTTTARELDDLWQRENVFLLGKDVLMMQALMIEWKLITLSGGQIGPANIGGLTQSGKCVMLSLTGGK